MQIIRAIWEPILVEGQQPIPNPYLDLAVNPPQLNEVVYVWDQSIKTELESRGYATRLIVDNRFSENGNQFGRKLLALEAGLQEFGEVLFLDWDCYFTKPMDQTFTDMLAEKETQIPVYIHNVLDPHNSSLELAPDTYISSNFGFFYTRNPNLGTNLINVATAYNIEGCVEEWAWNIHSGLKDDPIAYVQNYLPRFGHGVSEDAIPLQNINRQRQQAAWTWVEDKLNMDIYLKHT